jgi:hypothetical protein
MSLWSWLRGLGKREDEDALRRAEDERHETRDEQRFTEGDIEGIQADQRASRDFLQTPEQTERLAEDDE